MRLLTFLVIAGLPGATFAQGSLAEVQKAAHGLLGAEVSAAELGLPADPDAPKAGVLTASRASDSAPSDFDADKIAGNAPVSAPLALRLKAPGLLPEPRPDEADLGTGPDGEKVAELVASKAAEGRTTTYDADKIDGNPETFPPLALRQKAPGQAPEGVTEADFGASANLDAPKALDLVVSYADGRATIYDEDKIDGNEPLPEPLGMRQKGPSFLTVTVSDADLGILDSLPAVKSADLAVSHVDAVTSFYDEDKIEGNEEVYDTGPLAARQKYPSELADGTDPAEFGLPAVAAPKIELAVSKAEIGVPNVEDNDKIAGNPYIAPPLLPRQKLPSTLPDPVVDADLGQPVVEAAKSEMAVSKAAEGQPSIEDNDKIVGNPVVSPPLAERSKAPSDDTVTAGLSDAELGLLLAPDAAKVAQIEASKQAESLITEYDDDKISGNSAADSSYDDYATESFEIEPPSELIAAVRALLDDPETRSTMMEGVAARALAPPDMAAAFAGYIATLFDEPAVRDLMATEIARVFMDMGLSANSPVSVGRMAAEYISAFGAPQAQLGMARLPVADQRGYLAGLLRIADTMTPAQCGAFLQGTLDPVQDSRLLLAAIAAWPVAEREAFLAQRAAAAIAEVQGAPFEALSETDAQTARAAIGAVASAAIDAAPNADALFMAFGDPLTADPADLCTVHRLILQGALANTGPDADLGVRYLVEFGWQS